MLDLLFFLPAAFAGLILVMTLWTGRAFDTTWYRRPSVVTRREEPRIYWSVVLANAAIFAVLAWHALDFIRL